MNLPIPPTEIPSARKYSRSFHAEQGKKFHSRDSFTIQIPPISNTYLTKDVKLFFDFEMIYQEASTETLVKLYDDLITTFGPISEEVEHEPQYIIHGNSFFGRDVNGNILPYRSTNQYTKPIPTMDINGPYGFIKRIQVHDYLGTTLIEDIQEHDLLTAQFADFWFKNDNFEVHRPRMSDLLEKYNNQTIVFKEPCSRFTALNDASFLNAPIACSVFNTKVNPLGTKFSLDIQPSPIYVRQQFSIDLFSFLGRLSDKYVPLHNGFKITFSLNDFNVPIVFNTCNGGNAVFYQRYYSGVPPKTYGVTQLNPSILSVDISNVHLSTDLLEISPELDGKVDKTILAHAWKYQKDFFPYSDFAVGYGLHDGVRTPFVKRITPNLRSVNKIFVGQRLQNINSGKQNLGFRVSNYNNESTLYYNKSVVSSQKGVLETYRGLQKTMNMYFDDYLSLKDFEVDEPYTVGTNAQQCMIVPYETRKLIAEYVSANVSTNPWWPGFEGISTYHVYLGVQAKDPLSFTYFTPIRQGRYLVAFDTRLPGELPNSVAGIDTEKAILEYELKTSETTCQRVDIDVFIEHDSFIFVDPGKSTSVSF